ncbi:hypothetical protein SOVF_024040 [Spinacia oleracea]|uniref:Calmodulin-like protein 30 n=1 Tax=Spinacia oleracea TaxID=3562 RepID=A0A9R0JXU9_SPIOL|nr:calmodulin-like protein 30 [Spinacia oleracea]KNA23506.1 hypothetical protein SOVF_024040 [Spinacia oleracea]
MSTVKFLDFQYSKNKLSQNSKRLFSFSNKQYSSILPVFLPSVDEMHQVFDRFDKNKDGKISQEEYKAILKTMGKAESVGKIFQVADSNKDGYIDFKEFMALHKDGGGVRTMDIRNAFRVFDLDEDGKISSEEVHEMLKRLGERCTLADCRNMVRAADTDGDGFISMNEFIIMMTRNMTRH